MYLPDINFWLSLAFDADAHHVVTKSWFDTVPDASCCFCRYTQQGFLRLANNPKVFPNDVLTQSRAWQVYDSMMTDARITFASEPERLEPHWRGYTQTATHAPNRWNDAYLAAFAITGGYEIVTYDKGFATYSGLRCMVLT